MSHGDSYSMVLPDHKPRRDWQAPTLAILGVALFLAISAVIFLIGRSQYRFNQFIGALAHSTEYAVRMHSFTLSDGDSAAEGGFADQILYVVIDAKAGRERKELPEDAAGLTCVYGNGCVLRLWETEVADESMGRGREMAPGTLAAFTDQDGRVYAYETKNIDYPSLRRYLIGEADAYYAPYLPDISPLLEHKPFQRP